MRSSLGSRLLSKTFFATGCHSHFSPILYPISWTTSFLSIELIEKGLRAAQRGEASTLRAMCAVCYAERAIYEIPDDELTAERVLKEIRAVEQRCLGNVAESASRSGLG